MADLFPTEGMRSGGGRWPCTNPSAALTIRRARPTAPREAAADADAGDRCGVAFCAVACTCTSLAMSACVCPCQAAAQRAARKCGLKDREHPREGRAGRCPCHPRIATADRACGPSALAARPPRRNASQNEFFVNTGAARAMASTQAERAGGRRRRCSAYRPEWPRSARRTCASRGSAREPRAR